MLHKFTITFRLVVGEGGKLRRKDVTKTCSSSPMAAVGLGILVQVSSHNSKTVLKPAAFRLSQPVISRAQEQSCYLKSCFLCNKNLSHDLDIYMYRGDQGFCSVECRNRQIVLDETRELELCTKNTIAAYRRCSGVSETGKLLEDLRTRNKHISTQKARAIFS